MIREVKKPVQLQSDAGPGELSAGNRRRTRGAPPGKVGEAGGPRGEQGQFQPGGRSKRTGRAGCILHRRTAAVSGEERSREKSRSTAGQTEQLTGGFTSTAGNCCWRALKSCARPESNNKRKSNKFNFKNNNKVKSLRESFFSSVKVNFSFE